MLLHKQIKPNLLHGGMIDDKKINLRTLADGRDG